ncbi:MAG: hypothetical protein PHC74_09930, partial [Sulfurimonas sp.]|nr:hypothetical protein [Sulfurimonas sp.]
PPILLPAFISRANCSTSISIFMCHSLSKYNFTRLTRNYERSPPNKEFLIAMSWFFLNLQQNQEKAFYWLNRFDGLKISLNHYAQYIVIWYNTVKKVQDDTYSMRQN